MSHLTQVASLYHLASGSSNYTHRDKNLFGSQAPFCVSSWLIRSNDSVAITCFRDTPKISKNLALQKLGSLDEAGDYRRIIAGYPEFRKTFGKLFFTEIKTVFYIRFQYSDQNAIWLSEKLFIYSSLKEKLMHIEILRKN